MKRDDQKVSHSLARFIKLKEAATVNKKKKKKNSVKPIVDNEDKPGTEFGVKNAIQLNKIHSIFQKITKVNQRQRMRPTTIAT